LEEYTASTHLISEAVQKIFDEKVNSELKVRRIMIDVCNVKREEEARTELRQLNLFEKNDRAELAKEQRANEAVIAIKKRYGKNAILKGINFEEGATGRERNRQIGGHKA